MCCTKEDILLRNVSRREILEYLDRLGFKQSELGMPYMSGDIKLRLSETCKSELCAIRIDETSMEIEGPRDQVVALKEKIRFHFLRAGG
jgi:isopropylmalate/homocitrate/citramalate synthase